MDNINSINFGSVNIPNSGINKDAQGTTQQPAENAAPQVETKNISGSDVLDFMANSNIVMQSMVKPSANSLVNKYNTPEQIARITGNMLNEFVPGAVEALGHFEAELGTVPAWQNLADDDKLALGAELFSSFDIEE